MSENILKGNPPEYSHIKNLIIKGKHEEALQLMNKLEKGEFGPKDNILYYKEEED